MHDEFATFHRGLTAPAEDAASITPDDAADLPRPTRGLYVGTGGAARVSLVGGAEVVLVGLIAGVIYPLRIARVHATDTTASDLVGLY